VSSNSYTSANITPSSDTFREWVDLTNRITYDMEKYVVTTAPTNNTQGAETVGNGYVNGYFGSNTLIVFDEIGGAIGNVTHYGTRSPQANLVISTNAVFVDDGNNTSIIHAQSNVFVTNVGFQLTSNSDNTHVTVNTTADIFESNAGVNIFNTIMDVNANVDIDNDLVTINSGNVTIQGNTTAGELNVDSNTTFTANVNITEDALDVNIGADEVFINSSASLFKSEATLNDFNSNVDIDNDLTTINAGNVHINGNTTAGEFNVDSNTVFTANINITEDSEDLNIGADQVIINSSASLFKSEATLNDFDSDIDIDNTLTDINSTTVNIAGTTANLDSTTTNINGTTLDIDSATVDIDSATLVDINAPDVNISGANATISTTNVNITSTGVNIGDANSDLLTVNSNTVLTDKLNVQKDADFDSDINVDGSAQVDGSLTVGNSTANAHISTEGNIDTDGTLTVAGASDLNSTLDVAGATTLESTLQVQGTSEFQDDIYVGDSTTNCAIDAQTGNIDTDGTLTVEGATDLNDTLDVAGVTTVEDTTDSTSNTTGALVVSGGAGIAKTVTIGENLDVEGNADVAGELDVVSSALFQSTANVDGLFRAKSDAHITGTANVTVQLNVGADVHANTTAIAVGDGSDTEVVIKDNSIIVGNSTTNTSISTTAVFTDGTLQAEGATDLNSTLAVSGAATFEDTTNSTSNTTGSIIVSGGAGIAKSATVGEDLTVHGNTDIKGGVILGDAATDIIQIKGRANTSFLPDETANSTNSRDLGSTSLKWNLNADNSRTRLLTVSENATVDGYANISGSANVGLDFSVSNSTTTSIRAETWNGGANRRVIIGNTVPTATVAVDRLVVRSAVGNSTIGLLPLHGNNVSLGDGDHRWVLSAKTGHFSGNVTVTDATQSSSKTTGSGKFSGGIGVAKKAYIGGDFVAEASANVTGTARLAIGGSRVDVGNTTSGEANTYTLRVRSDSVLEGNMKAASANVTGHSNLATLGATGAVDFDSTLTVEGTATFNGSLDLGSAADDTITINAQVDASLEPNANDVALGHADRRWNLAAAAINSSGNALIGGSLDVDSTTNSTSNTTGAITTAGGLGVAKSGTIGENLTVEGDLIGEGDLDIGTSSSGEANTYTLRVRSSSSFEDATVNFGNSTVYANLSSNSTQVKFETGKLQAADLEITGSATLPSDTTLTTDTTTAATLTVTNKAEFTGAATDGGANNSIKIGNGNDRVTVNMANAVVNTHFIPDATSRDLGTTSNQWGEAHLADKVLVGNSTINCSAFTNSTASYVVADNIYARDDIVAAQSSDKLLKENLLIIDTALSKIEQVSGYEFEWNQNIQDERVGKKEYGVIAQEIEQILPHAVNINSRGYRTVHYNSLIPLLIEAVKELSGRVKELEGRREVDNG